MYSKQQASQIRQEFWTAFGRYMQPVLSASGEKINWMNYKTGAKNIYFRMHAGKGAEIAVELTHPNEAQRLENWEKLLQLRTLFENILAEEWTWDPQFSDAHGKRMGRVYLAQTGINVFNKSDWPAFISFFKPRMIALDRFWNEVKPVFDVWD